jgi:hypothetical protein
MGGLVCMMPFHKDSGPPMMSVLGALRLWLLKKPEPAFAFGMKRVRFLLAIIIIKAILCS